MKIGILIIGSLIWDNAHRKRWRDDRLDIAAQQFVKTHTRYGRISSQRKYTYTMVFSRTAQPSRAIVAPCQRPANCAEDVFEEARQLANAEGLGFDGRWRSFGAVAAIANPDSSQALEYLRDWPRYFSNHVNRKCDVTAESAFDESPCVTRDGFLDINWPHMVEPTVRNDCDILLATANAPTLETGGIYPPAGMIAENFLRQEYTEYFVNNVLHQIVTADDAAIWRQLSAAGPAWLKDADKRRISVILSRE